MGPLNNLIVFQAMVYARAVWVENGQQMEGVLPLNWIDTETKVVRWPLKKVSVAHKRLLQPQEDWLSFEFVKVKVTSGDKKYFEGYFWHVLQLIFQLKYYNTIIHITIANSVCFHS